MPIQGPTYKKGEKVTYTSFGKSCEALILGAHLDDALEPYYTIQLSDGREKQTDDAHLSPLSFNFNPQQQEQSPPTTTLPSKHRSTHTSQQHGAAPLNQPAPRKKDQRLTKPQDRPWDMTGKEATSSPYYKQQQQTSKGDGGTRQAARRLQQHPPSNPQPRKRTPQQQASSSSSRRRPYERTQTHYDPAWRSSARRQGHDPFGSPSSTFGGGGRGAPAPSGMMPIRSRL